MQSSRKLTLPYFLPERNLILRNSSVIKYSVSTTLSPYPVSLTVAKILFLLILISLSISSLINHISSFHFQKQLYCKGQVSALFFFFFCFFAKTVPLRSLIHRLPYSANSNNFVHYFLTTNRSNHSPWLTTLARVVEELSLEMTIANHSRCQNRVSTKNGWGRFERVQSV